MKEKFKYWWTVAYLPVYLLLFGIAEAMVTDVTVIGLPFDYKIPFVECFIVPYLLWFPYIAVTFLWFFFRDKQEFLQYMGFLYIGMTVFLVVSFIFPNGLNLRPETFVRDNVFTRMIAILYSTDTPTNVLPSIHVYNSIGAAAAIVKSKHVAVRKYQKVIAVIISTLIILSTVFIKQHSVVDVAAAALLSILIYAVIYRRT